MSDRPEKNVADRLARIEREVRGWRIVGVLSLGCLLLFGTLGANTNPETPRLIKAHEFQLVDDDGNVRGTWRTLGRTFTQFRLSNGTGQSEAVISAGDTNAIVHLTNDNRINSAVIGAYSSGGAMGLSRKTDDGKAFTNVIGGTEGSFVELQPLKGDATVLPPEQARNREKLTR